MTASAEGAYGLLDLLLEGRALEGSTMTTRDACSTPRR